MESLLQSVIKSIVSPIEVQKLKGINMGEKRGTKPPLRVGI